MLAVTIEIGHYALVVGAPVSVKSLVVDHRNARTAFWRTFAAGVFVYALPLTVTLSLRYNDFSRVVSGLIVYLVIWSLWAMLAPRGASLVALILFALGLVNVIVGSLILYRDEGLVVMIPFATVAIPCDVFALALIWSARPKAQALVRARKALRRERRDERIRAGGGM